MIQKAIWSFLVITKCSRKIFNLCIYPRNHGNYSGRKKMKINKSNFAMVHNRHKDEEVRSRLLIMIHWNIIIIKHFDSYKSTSINKYWDVAYFTLKTFLHDDGKTNKIVIKIKEEIYNFMIFYIYYVSNMEHFWNYLITNQTSIKVNVFF